MAVLTREEKFIRVVRKDHTGRILRISKYSFRRGVQRPVSEMIYYGNGHSTLYLYNGEGDEVDHVVQFDRQTSLESVSLQMRQNPSFSRSPVSVSNVSKAPV